MGANSKQGWCLLFFLIGFTFLVAGLAYLGFLFALGGLVLLIGSLVGFHQIKPLEQEEATGNPTVAAPAPSLSKNKQAL